MWLCLREDSCKGACARAQEIQEFQPGTAGFLQIPITQTASGSLEGESSSLCSGNVLGAPHEALAKQLLMGTSSLAGQGALQRNLTTSPQIMGDGMRTSDGNYRPSPQKTEYLPSELKSPKQPKLQGAVFQCPRPPAPTREELSSKHREN